MSLLDCKSTHFSCSDQLFLQILGVIAVSASVIPWILIPVLPLFIVFIYLRRYFLQTSRDVKRLESTSECRPVHRWISGVVHFWRAGSVCVLLILQLEVPSSPTCPRLFRACGPSEHSRQRTGSRKPLMNIKTCTHVRNFRFYCIIKGLWSLRCNWSIWFALTEAWFLFLTTSRWFALRLDAICSVFVTVTTFACLLLRNRKDVD